MLCPVYAGSGTYPRLLNAFRPKETFLNNEDRQKLKDERNPLLNMWKAVESFFDGLPAVGSQDLGGR